jgi:hypothetical protein
VEHARHDAHSDRSRDQRDALKPLHCRPFLTNWSLRMAPTLVLTSNLLPGLAGTHE